jgi:serine protease AprX
LLRQAIRHEGGATRLAAVLAVAIVAAGAGSVRAPVAAAGPERPASSETAFVAAELLGQVEQNPNGLFDVIVQGSSSHAVGAIVREQASASPGAASALGREFTTVNGVAAQLTGRQILNVARMPGVTAITPDAPVSLDGSLSSRQQWPFVSGVALGWAAIESGSLPPAPTIAVVDSGVDGTRSDFAGRLIRQVTITSRLVNSPGDGRGHGTFVAGIAAGSASGYTGAAPSAKLISLDVLDDQGIALTSDVIAAADWIYANKSAYNIRVANFSLHSTVPASVFWDPLDRAVEKLWLNGVVVVAAAGNYAVDGAPSGVLFAPGNDPFVITVGANDIRGSVSTVDDKAAPWSSYGYTIDGFAKPDLAAPGRYMIGPVPAGSTLALERPLSVVAPGYMKLSGTSFAAPVAAGAAAYLLALHPSWTPDQVKGALMLTAKQAPLATPLSVGVGELDAGRAAALVAPPNANLALQQYVVTDPIDGVTRSFDAASWGSDAQADASWGTASWGTASWGTASWGSSSWGSLYWSTASWGTASWGTASWGSSTWASASWGSASWGSLAVSDNADGDTGEPALLDLAQVAEAEDELGVKIGLDGSVSLAGAPQLVP